MEPLRIHQDEANVHNRHVNKLVHNRLLHDVRFTCSNFVEIFVENKQNINKICVQPAMPHTPLSPRPTSFFEGLLGLDPQLTEGVVE